MPTLDELITYQRAELRPPGHPARSASLFVLARSLYKRFKKAGSMGDLAEVIALDQASLEINPVGHPDRPIFLHNLALDLYEKHHVQHTMADIQEAIVLAQEATELCPTAHPHRWQYITTLANLLNDRFEEQGSVTDLDAVITLDREASELCPPGHRSESLGNFAWDLYKRHKLQQDRASLNEAIVHGQEALGLCQAENSHRSIILGNLACYLDERFKSEGALVDIEEAILLGQEALDLCPEGNPDRLAMLDNLAPRYLYLEIKAIADVTTCLDEVSCKGQCDCESSGTWRREKMPLHGQLEGPGVPVALNAHTGMWMGPPNFLLNSRDNEAASVAPDTAKEAGEGDSEGDDRTYCFCDGISYGEMIACDDENCEREWFHLACVGLTVPPEGTWFCDVCRAKQRNAKRGARVNI